MPDTATTDIEWGVSAPFLQHVTVGEDDLDAFGHTNNVVYLRWLERVAWAHSVSLGLDMDVYQRLNAGCVARRHELDYLLPTFAGEALAVATWIDENDGKATMWRGYAIARLSDARHVLRARTLWACIDMKTGRPKRQPQAFLDAYRPATALA